MHQNGVCVCVCGGGGGALHGAPERLLFARDLISYIFYIIPHVRILAAFENWASIQIRTRHSPYLTPSDQKEHEPASPDPEKERERG